jgi:GT2 family glycosyltransferase
MDACYKEGVSKIIVVDNDSEQNSKQKLKKYENQNQKRLKVVYLNENTGSAGGYKRGLEEAYNNSECEFIWLLDDDNMPQKDSLKVLKDFWNNLEQKDKKEKVALLSRRDGRDIYLKAIKNSMNLEGKRNSFLKFHISDILLKLKNIIKSKLGLISKEENITIRSGKVSIAYFGGMFFHKKLINIIKYPKEELFVYGDDHEWSYRITKDGGDIFYIYDSYLKDLDLSWMNEGSRSSFFYALLNKGNDFRIYYSVRNGVYFDLKYLVKNKFIYMINMYTFIIILQLFRNKSNLKRYKIFKKAIDDGLNNNLGNTL